MIVITRGTSIVGQNTGASSIIGLHASAGSHLDDVCKMTTIYIMIVIFKSLSIALSWKKMGIRSFKFDFTSRLSR